LAEELKAQLCVIEVLSLGLLVPEAVENPLPLFEFLFCEPQMRLKLFWVCQAQDAVDLLAGLQVIIDIRNFIGAVRTELARLHGTLLPPFVIVREALEHTRERVWVLGWLQQNR